MKETANIHGTDGRNLTEVLPEEDPSYVYIFYSGGKVKIGTTKLRDAEKAN